MKKTKIAFVVHNLVTGGIAKSLVELTSIIDYDKYEVTVWMIKEEGDFVKLLHPKVIIKTFSSISSKDILKQYLCKGKIFKLLRGCYYRVLARLFKHDWWRSGKYAALAVRDASDQYDCAIAYYGKSFLIDLYTLYRIKATKHILWIHGEHPMDEKIIPMMDKGYAEFDRIYCVSKSIQKLFNDKFRIAASKTEVLYNYVNPDQIRILSDAHIPHMEEYSLVTVGRLSEEKGQALIPRTVRNLKEKGYVVHWYIIGDGPLRNSIEESIVENSVESFVHLLGAKENPYPYIKHCNIYVQTSFSEGWGLTVQEARILHKPMVVTPLSAMYEQITNGKNGLIAAETTPEAISASIGFLLDHPELQQEFIEVLGKENNNYEELQKLLDYIES